MCVVGINRLVIATYTALIPEGYLSIGYQGYIEVGFNIRIYIYNPSYTYSCTMIKLSGFPIHYIIWLKYVRNTIIVSHMSLVLYLPTLTSCAKTIFEILTNEIWH